VTEKFVSVKALDSQIEAGKVLLKSNDYRQLVSYEQIVQEMAKKDKQREQAATAALAKSIRRGMEQGKEKANEQLSVKLVDFTQAMQDSIARIEDQLVDVVANAVRKIILDFDDKALVQNAVHSGLELVRGAHKLSIRVHPQMQGSIVEYLDGLQNRTDHIEVIGDSQLGMDECVLESDVGIVNAGIDLQLKAVVASLKGAFVEKRDE